MVALPEPDPPPRGAGRPSKLTPELQARICGFVAKGHTYADACRLSGIAERTFYYWKATGEAATDPRSKYLQFLQAIRDADAEFTRTHLDAVTRSALEETTETREHVKTTTAADGTEVKIKEVTKIRKPPSAKSAMWLLERKRPEEFGRRIQHAGKVDSDQVVEHRGPKQPFEIVIVDPGGEDEDGAEEANGDGGGPLADPARPDPAAGA